MRTAQREQKKAMEKRGYTVHVNTNFHWTVTRKDRPGIVVNVWPTAKKILKKYSPGPAPYYDSLARALEKEFGPVEFEEEVITSERQQAIDLLDYYRQNHETLFRNTKLFKEYLTAL